VTPRLPSVTPAKAVAALKRGGFEVMRKRGSGSHSVLAHPDGREVVVAIHAREMKRGTLTALIKQAGFTQDEFMDLLK
jgi:predicted RNA binding protein YcfA (HicA-like mRNA interferase family)